MSLMDRVEQAISRLQSSNEELVGARNSCSYRSHGDAIACGVNNQINRLTEKLLELPGDIVEGAGEAVKDELSGLWDAVTNPIETVKDSWAGLQEAVDDPIGAAKEAWNDFTEPYVEDWENGHPGQAIGRGLVEAALLASPTKIFKGLKALGGDGDDAPETPNDPDGSDGGEPEDTPSVDGNDEPNNGSVSDEDRAAELDKATRDWHDNARQHIFQGNFNPATGQLAGGLHTQAGLDAFLERKPEFEPISRETLENGVERVEFPPEALTEKAQIQTEAAASNGRGIPNGKTIFPEDWDENKIADALNQTKDKGVQISSTSWGGTTKTLDVNGVKVEVNLDKNGNVISGYPSWNQ